MLLNVLAVGDVASEVGLDCLHRHLRAIKKQHKVHFTVVNGENAAGIGLLPRQRKLAFPSTESACRGTITYIGTT